MLLNDTASNVPIMMVESNNLHFHDAVENTVSSILIDGVTRKTSQRQLQNHSVYWQATFEAADDLYREEFNRYEIKHFYQL